MLFSSVNGYRIKVIELSRYGRLLRRITFLLCNRENMFWSCDLGSRVHDTWPYMTWKTFFPNASVWMTQSMVRAGYEG